MILKDLAKRVFATKPGLRLRMRLLGLRGFVALTYHRINGADSMFDGHSRGIFEAQMEWLSRNVRTLRAVEVARVLEAAPSPELEVLVTFDDGYRDFAEHAYPVLKRYGIPALVFLPTKYMDEGGLIWTDRVMAAFRLTERSKFDEPWPGGSCVDLASAPARAAAAARAKKAMKMALDEERREWEEVLLTQLEVKTALDDLPREMLDWNEVRAMRDIVDFGSHSHSHPIMSRLKPAEFERELAISRDRLITELGSHPRWFAYPNGTQLDIPDDAGEVLQRLGYEAAFSTIPGLNAYGAIDRWRIRRQPTMGATLADFAWLVASRGEYT